MAVNNCHFFFYTLEKSRQTARFSIIFPGQFLSKSALKTSLYHGDSDPVYELSIPVLVGF
jgi:hypothetical protein